MFKELLGLPAHPLLVHAAVVFVPLLVLFAIGYAILPRFRSKVGWAAAILAVVAPASAFVAAESGEALQEVLVAKGYSPQIIDQISEHQEYGELLLWFTLALGVATGLLLYVTSKRARRRRLPGWVPQVITAVVVVLGVLCATFVYLTGHSGAQAVWTGVL